MDSYSHADITSKTFLYAGLKRTGARRLSRQPSGGEGVGGSGRDSLMMSIYKPKGRRSSPLVRRRQDDSDEAKRKKKEEIINFQLNASLREVTVLSCTYTLAQRYMHLKHHYRYCTNNHSHQLAF
jgi:hypothetical protein